MKTMAWLEKDLNEVVTGNFGFDPLSVCFSLFLRELLGSSHSLKDMQVKWS